MEYQMGSVPTFAESDLSNLDCMEINLDSMLVFDKARLVVWY